MDFLSAGWVWLYAGAGLMLAEILMPGFVVFFFGLSAATLGALILVLPDAFHLTLAWQLALFSLFSVVYLVTLRRYLKSVFLGDSEDKLSASDEFTGRTGEVVVGLNVTILNALTCVYPSLIKSVATREISNAIIV